MKEIVTFLAVRRARVSAAAMAPDRLQTQSNEN